MKSQKIAYWIFTILISSFLIFTGAADVALPEELAQGMTHVGFPLSLVPFLGVLKIAGGLTLLFVKNEHLRVGAYAGTLFYGLGAIAAHLAISDPLPMALPGFLVVGLDLASYFLWKRLPARPATA